MAFTKYPLHSMILKGLKASGFTSPTLVQRRIIPLAMKGLNIVCSAKTGSGKTLAFIVPILQRLMECRWSRTDGLGAIIITPTRELAMQAFEVLQSVGRYTNLSGGLLIGGRNAEYEKDKVAALNIVVCTPGRLLEHLESVWDFSGDNLECLVIDEADKLLEMGFKQTIESITEYITKKRQTLLFSATTQSISRSQQIWDIPSPEFINIQDNLLEDREPQIEQQVYSVTLPQKFDLLYKIIKSNQQKKIIVFLSTCKEVSFYHALFKRLRLGLPLLHLNGNMSQNKRIETYQKFSKKEPQLLFSTDIAARGLDFPGIHLVVQLDAPDTKETYIHRIGRTARNGEKGKAILAILPHEQGILTELSSYPNFPTPHKFRFSKSISSRVSAVIKESEEVYLLAQKYVKTYKGYLRVLKKEYLSNPEETISSLVSYLGVKEDDNVSWSSGTTPKSKLLPNRHTVFE
ncbi:ATP-dependent RNA helicase DDX10/DBP4 [Nematocida sp. AWRm80]|nr:ATP-dependent RNA helicase DDX10/DBP4 [Nematocida sp. AWRm80]